SCGASTTPRAKALPYARFLFFPWLRFPLIASTEFRRFPPAIVARFILGQFPLKCLQSPHSKQVKENQEKDKIGSKPDKNRKRVEAGKSLKQLQWRGQEKLNKTQKEWPKIQTQSKAIQVFKERRKEMGQKCNFSKVQPQGPKLSTVESCMAKDDGCK
nr:hypothetical protein [Tanacetum cinerariifolium]